MDAPGIFTLTVNGPNELLDAVWHCEVEVKGFDRDEMDRSNLEYRASELVAKRLGYKSYDDMPERFTPVSFSPPVRTANQYRNVDGTQQFFVGVFRVGQGYGGAEEGGWWFECGELVQQTVVPTWDDALAAVEALKEQFPHTRKRSSVLGGDDFDIHIDIEPMPESFPEVRPHYE